MSVVAQIRGYLDRVEDIDYLENILSEVPLSDLFRDLLQLIQGPSADDVGRADLFIRDVIYRAKRNNGPFNEQLFAAGIPSAYVQNVFREDFGIRRNSVSTLGIFHDWWSAKQIENAVVFSELNDPTLLPRLVRLTMFQNQWKDWTLPKRIVNSSDFLVRWSMLEVLDHNLHFPLPRYEILSEAKACLVNLQQDVNPMVKGEADFLRSRMDYYEIMATLPKPEKRKRSKAINQATPKIRFDSFWLFVGNELGARRKTDFTMAELHELAEDFQTPK